MTRLFRSRQLLGLMLAASAIFAASASSPVTAQSDEKPTPEQLLEDFNFYVNVANEELALANANALLEMGLSPVEFVGIVEDSSTLQQRFDRAYRRALANPQLADVAAKLQRLYQDGRLEIARNPDEIARNIDLLDDNRRAQLLARERLKFAGEYSVPQLLEILMAARAEDLETEVQTLLIEMGRESIVPLCTALPKLDPRTQEVVARILGQIPYDTSVPYLAELRATTEHESVRAAAERSLSRLGGRYDAGSALGGLYRQLAEQYYAEVGSMTPFPNEAHQLLWDFDASIGLIATAILTEVFHEARAMELTEHALRLDPTDQQSISLWLAANFSRELDQPEGYENPAYPPVRRSATYFAVAAGPSAVQRVLGRALEARDTRLARQAIAAIERSAGESGLKNELGEGQPLIDALGYPDRRVQYEAALALGAASPTTMFDGAERVIPILAGAIRDASKRFAVVVARDQERQQVLRSILEGQGYSVLPPVGRLSDAASSIADVPGIDLIVSDLTGNSTEEMIDEIRRSPRLRATPVLALVSTSAMVQLGARFGDDPMIRMAREGINAEQTAESARQLVEFASGQPVGPEEGREYAMKSLQVLSDLSVGGSTVFDVADATVPLMAALSETTDDVRLRVGEVLSFIGQQRVQVALMDAAMNSEGGERIALMERVIASAKRFGNLLESRQVRWLMQRVRDAEDEEATTAAALAGALSLPNDQYVELLLSETEKR